MQHVARYGVYHGYMASVLGRNVVFGYEQFSLSVNDVTCGQLDLGLMYFAYNLHINNNNNSHQRHLGVSEYSLTD